MAEQLMSNQVGKNEKEDSERLITLTTKTGLEFQVSIATAKVSKTICTMLDSVENVETMDCDSDSGSGDSSATPILIDCPHIEVLGKVLEWAKYHRNDHPGEMIRSEDEYSGWDLMFFNVTENTLLRILVVSNFLEMKNLFRQTLTMLRHRLRSQSEEELRRRSGAYGEPGQLFSERELIQLKKEAALVKPSKSK